MSCQKKGSTSSPDSPWGNTWGPRRQNVQHVTNTLAKHQQQQSGTFQASTRQVSGDNPRPTNYPRQKVWCWDKLSASPAAVGSYSRPTRLRSTIVSPGVFLLNSYYTRYKIQDSNRALHMVGTKSCRRKWVHPTGPKRSRFGPRSGNPDLVGSTAAHRNQVPCSSLYCIRRVFLLF